MANTNQLETGINKGLDVLKTGSDVVRNVTSSQGKEALDAKMQGSLARLAAQVNQNDPSTAQRLNAAKTKGEALNLLRDLNDNIRKGANVGKVTAADVNAVHDEIEQAPLGLTTRPIEQLGRQAVEELQNMNPLVKQGLFAGGLFLMLNRFRKGARDTYRSGKRMVNNGVSRVGNFLWSAAKWGLALFGITTAYKSGVIDPILDDKLKAKPTNAPASFPIKPPQKLVVSTPTPKTVDTEPTAQA